MLSVTTCRQSFASEQPIHTRHRSYVFDSVQSLLLTLFQPFQGELEHRRVKRFYARTNKNAYVRQIARQERRERLLRGIEKRMRSASILGMVAPPDAVASQPEYLPPTAPRAHHHISEDRRYGITVRAYLEAAEQPTGHSEDPAIKVSGIN